MLFPQGGLQGRDPRLSPSLPVGRTPREGMRAGNPVVPEALLSDANNPSRVGCAEWQLSPIQTRDMCTEYVRMNLLPR